MRVFINLLIKTDAYDDVDKIEDIVCAAIEAEGLEIIWHKSVERLESY